MRHTQDWAITTVDNRFDPFEQPERWLKEDILLGHRTCEKLAALANTSINLSDEENDREISSAMDRMIKEEPLLYKKVVRDA